MSPEPALHTNPALAALTRGLQSLLESVHDDVDRAAEAVSRIMSVLHDIADARLRLLRAIEQHRIDRDDSVLPDVVADVRCVLADVVPRLGTYRPSPLEHHRLS